MTHARYARMVREYIKQNFDIGLKNKSLIYGSVKPDASTIFAKYPHYIDRSLDEICNRIDILINTVQEKYEIETNVYSRELGVVLHYIADYFCYVHNDINDIKHDESFRHILYEKSLNQATRKNVLEIINKSFYEELEKNSRQIKRTGLKQFITDKNNRYKREAGKQYVYNDLEKHFYTDIEYSYKMVLTIACYICKGGFYGKRRKQ